MREKRCRAGKRSTRTRRVIAEAFTEKGISVRIDGAEALCLVEFEMCG
jgi:hypothetical protein